MDTCGAIYQWTAFALASVSITAILGLVQVIKWVLIGKGLLERREDGPTTRELFERMQPTKGAGK